jgi:tRNA threonylcarbamoyladenosine biosynthesis protein TsaB
MRGRAGRGGAVTRLSARMRILAIDTALDACSAAVFDSGEDLALAAESRPMHRGHAEALMPLLARVMDEAGVEFRELDRLAVTVGPGSFTGVRVGISAARGIALAANKPAIAISTLSAFAAPHLMATPGPVLAVVDARHAHVYAQLFGPGGSALSPPKIVATAEAAMLAMEDKAQVVGSGAARVGAAWPAGSRPRVFPETAPDIVWVARFGAAAPANPVGPKPLYLRAPDARPQLARQLPRR